MGMGGFSDLFLFQPISNYVVSLSVQLMSCLLDSTLFPCSKVRSETKNLPHILRIYLFVFLFLFLSLSLSLSLSLFLSLFLSLSLLYFYYYGYRYCNRYYLGCRDLSTPRSERGGAPELSNREKENSC